MITITRLHVRVVALVALFVLLAASVVPYLERHGYLGETVARASLWSHQGLLLPYWLLYSLGIVLMLIAICGLVGTALLRDWGRRLLAVSFVANFALGPFQGIVIHGPVGIFAVSTYGVLHFWLVVVTYWSPISETFNGRG